jgi:hypothetical protein
MKNKILLNNKIKYLAAVAVALLCYLSATASQGLKEVVVLAYGSQRKADITAAVSQVDLSRSQGIPASNVGRLLQGQAPGVVAKANLRPAGAGVTGRDTW